MANKMNQFPVMKMLVAAIKIVAVLLLSITLLGFGQIAQFTQSVADLRVAAFDGWAGDDKEKQQKVAGFKAVCLGDALNTNRTDKKIHELISSENGRTGIELCAHVNSFEELYSIYIRSRSPLKSNPWPLSLIASNLYSENKNQ